MIKERGRNMYLFSVNVMNLNTDKEVTSSSMIGDIADLKDKGSVTEIMEKLGEIVIEFNGEKGQVV